MTNRQLLMLIPGLFLAQFVSPAASGAQTLVTPSKYLDAQRGMTIEELVAQGLTHSKSIEAARHRSEAAQAERDQAGGRSNPSLGIGQREQAGGSDRQTSLEFALPLDLYRRASRIDASARAVTVAQTDQVREEWELAAQIRREGLKALAAIRVLELTAQQAEAARNLRDLVAASVDAGALPRLDRDAADVEARRMDATIPLRRAEVDAVMFTLKALCGLAPGDPLLMRRGLDDEIAAASSMTAGLLDLPADADRRPDLQVLREEVAYAEAQVSASRAAGKWDVELMGGYMHTAMSFPQFGFTTGGALAPVAGRFHEITFGARIMLPFNGNQGGTSAAEARTRALTADRADAALKAAAEGQAARVRWAALRESAGLYSGGLLALARQNLEVVQQTYLAGRGTLNDTIAERRRLLDLEMAYVGLQGDLGLADVEVRRTLGVIR
jgi:outer membrane protein TolC